MNRKEKKRKTGEVSVAQACDSWSWNWNPAIDYGCVSSTKQWCLWSKICCVPLANISSTLCFPQVESTSWTSIVSSDIPYRCTRLSLQRTGMLVVCPGKNPLRFHGGFQSSIHSTAILLRIRVDATRYMYCFMWALWF